MTVIRLLEFGPEDPEFSWNHQTGWVIAAWKSAIHGTASRLASRSFPVPSARVKLVLPVWGGGRYGRSSGGTTIRTRYFPLTICRKGFARILVNSRVGLKLGLTRDHSRGQKS